MMRRRYRRNASTLHSAAITLLFLYSSPTTVDADHISIGSITSTDTCYSALRSNQRPDENVIDKEAYVNFINDVSGNGGFKAFQYNKDLDEWGYFPVSEFEQLPANLRGEFYTHACGGPSIICENAFLYTDGTGEGEIPDPQQEVYLYHVCIGVEQAIEDARAKHNIAPTAKASKLFGKKSAKAFKAKSAKSKGYDDEANDAKSGKVSTKALMSAKSSKDTAEVDKKSPKAGFDTKSHVSSEDI